MDQNRKLPIKSNLRANLYLTSTNGKRTNVRTTLLQRFYLVAKKKISKHDILNFVGAHPRLIAIMAGLGISFTFSLIGKTVIHEILQSAYAINAFCSNCGASEFAPGHEAVSPGDAQNLAPGELDKSPGDAQNLAPGHLKK